MRDMRFVSTIGRSAVVVSLERLSLIRVFCVNAQLVGPVSKIVSIAHSRHVTYHRRVSSACRGPSVDGVNLSSCISGLIGGVGGYRHLD